MISRLWILRGALVVGGGLLGPWLTSGLQPSVTLEDPAWEVMAPRLGVSAEYRDDRSTVLLGGALSLGSRDIRRPDRLALRAPGEPVAVGISLAPESGEVSVRLRNATTRIRVEHVLVDGAWAEGDGSGRWNLRFEQGEWMVDTPTGPQSLASRAGGGESAWLELSSGYSGLGRIEHVLVEDGQGNMLAESDFTKQPKSWLHHLAGVLIGGLVALCLSGVAVLGVLPVLGVLAVSATTWVAWADRLVLVGVSGSQLGCWMFAVSMIPPVLWLMGRWGPHHGGSPRLGSRHWILAVLVSGALAVRTGMPGVWWLCLGLAWLAAPAWFLRRSGLDEVRGLLVDGPALIAVAILGWGHGFLVAALWRLGTVLASVPTLRTTSARSGADFALLVLLSCPIGVELALRSGPTDSWWDPAVLRGESEEKGEDWRQASASWSGSCGASVGVDTIRMAFAGGSATGGAFEFARHPEWFFPVRVHEAMCGDGESLRVETWNFGNTHRDTHTISRTIELMLEESQASVLVLYVGMNDLLTAEHPQTRAQREQAQLQRGWFSKGLVEVSEKSRLVTGLGLAMRSPAVGSSQSRMASVGVAGGQRRVQGYPSGVPVDDARSNLKRIAEACARQETRLVLVPQVLSRDERVLSSLDRRKYFDPYWKMEEALAGEFSHVYFIDGRALQEDWSDEHLLLDMNHMTRAGNEMLATLLVSEMKSLEVLP